MTRQRRLIQTITPTAGRRTHLALAALTWTLVGLGLTTAGIRWLLQSEGSMRWVGATAALGIGIGKGVLVLRQTARRNVLRILERGDGRCIGGFVSWRTWLFILAMMLLGRVLRASGLPTWLLGTIYAGVGLALVSSAVPIWMSLRTVGSASGKPQPPSSA